MHARCDAPIDIASPRSAIDIKYILSYQLIESESKSERVCLFVWGFNWVGERIIFR